jgi:hypothetical protein
MMVKRIWMIRMVGMIIMMIVGRRKGAIREEKEKQN